MTFSNIYTLISFTKLLQGCLRYVEDIFCPQEEAETPLGNQSARQDKVQQIYYHIYFSIKYSFTSGTIL